MNIIFMKDFERLPYLLRLLLIISGILLVFGTAIHLIEPEEFPTIFDGVWWAIITASTIGYGDYAPVTVKGRLVGILLVLVGAGFVSAYFVTLATQAVKKQNGILRGTITVNEKNHMVIIGWNERSRDIIYNLLKVQPDRSVVLIDSTLEENPLKKATNAYFLRGDAYSDDILKKANLKEAKLVLLTADPSKNEMDADMSTILNIVAIKGFSPNTYCIAEILTGEQVLNAKRAGADEVIPSNKLSSSMMLQTILTQGVSDALLNFVDILNGAKVKFVQNQSFIGHTFETVSKILLKDNIILIGVHRGDKTHIGPSPNFLITSDDKLLVISHE